MMEGADNGRRCGDCQLCCKLMPVRELDKPANQRCLNQKAGKGCKVYDRRPRSCRLWSCRWLLGGEGTEALRRPDRAHYVIDPLPEYIRIQPRDGTPESKIPVVQIWQDPRYPNAWQGGGLLAYLETQSAKGFAGLLRSGSSMGRVLIPPRMNGADKWQISETKIASEQHSAGDVMKAFEENGLAVHMEIARSESDA